MGRKGYCILVTIESLNRLAILVTDSLDFRRTGANVETPCCPNKHSPDICAHFLSFGYHRTNHVAGLESVVSFTPCTVPNRKPVFVRAAHLPIAVACRLNVQGFMTLHFVYTETVYQVLLNLAM